MVPVDYDSDGDSDLFVANDETPNVLFQNQGDGTFQDVALIAGVAYNGDGDVEAGMGADFGDYDQDGDPDLYVTHFFTETNTLYRNEGGVRFSDVTTTAGLAAATVEMLGWGTRFFDYDNDGRLDLFIANGHVYPQVDQAATGTTYRQPNQLFYNEGGGRFAPVSAESGLAQAKVSRGTSFGDYDDDGDIDLFVVELNDAPTLLRNDGGNAGNYLVVQIFGREDNRDGIGTRVSLQAAGKRQWRTVNGAASYLSHSDLRVHFGLGRGASHRPRRNHLSQRQHLRSRERTRQQALGRTPRAGARPLRTRRKSFLTINPRYARPAPAQFRRAAPARRKIRDGA